MLFDHTFLNQVSCLIYSQFETDDKFVGDSFCCITGGLQYILPWVDVNFYLEGIPLSCGFCSIRHLNLWWCRLKISTVASL